ncbi:hypothetical protein CMV_017747 [Castanea mollissima]|uniref:Uncharacterized protein n=1 Tax=Castanea mollissima TaxID=60419 RepID=A0A8J4VGV3_9ROSI|nr:hypothetical protein CMV_017747 [Castanea mollissima]
MASFSTQKAYRKVRKEQIQEWRTALKEVSKIRGRHLVDSHESEDIQEITKNIFDELNREIPDDHEHLVGEDKNRVAHIEGFGYEKNIETLKDKSLIAILGGKLRMHDLIQEMGWRIVSRESSQEPGRRSRLWFCKDVFHVLKENTGTEVVEGIVLDFQGAEVVEGMVLNLLPRKENLNDKAFSNMKNLSFQPDNLVELIMPRSHIEQLPKGLTNLAKLKLLDLSDSKVLVKTPNFIACPNLERLIFQGCTSLYELHPSVGALNKLTLLNLKDCRSLTGLPCEINLKSLEIFILSGCSSLKKFSEIGTNMTSLSELYLDGTAVEELPSSLEHLTGLTVLSLQGCKNLSSFPNSVNLPSLKTLNLSGCKVEPPKSWLSHGFSLIRAAHVFFQGFFPIREAIDLLLPMLRFIVSLNLGDRNLWDGGLPDDLSGLSSLQELDLSKNNLTRLPDSISQLSKLKSLTLNDCSRLQSLPNLPLSVGFVTARRCPLLEKYSNQVAVWTSGETGFTVVDCDKAEDLTTPIPIPSFPYDEFDPLFERYVKGVIRENNNYYELSNSTETPEWFSHQSLGSSVIIPLPSNLRGDSNWIGVALFTRVVILENLNNVSSGLGDEVSIDFICRSDMIDGPCISCPLENFSKALPGPLLHASSYGLKVLIPAGKLRDHLKDCSRISAFIRKKCTYIEIETCGARVLYKQDLVKFIRASGKMKQRSKCYLDDKVECSNLCQEVIHQNKNFLEFSNSTEIPDWFIDQNFGSSIRMRLPLDLHDNSSWIGIGLFAIVVVHKNLYSQDYKVFIEFNCRSDMVVGPVGRRPLGVDISKFLPERFRYASSFSFKFLARAWQLRDHLKECSWISTLITSDSPYVQIKMCGARVVYNNQDLEKFVQAEVKIKQRTKCQIDKVTSTQSNDRLKEKLMSLLLTVYQGDLAHSHKYDYVFPHMSVPDWFSNRSFCSDIRIKLPTNLQLEGRWMGIAVCAYYTVQERPVISGDNKDLTSFLNFYNPLVSHRVCLTRHRVFQESKDNFVDSSHRILVFYIPHVLLRLEECRHIGASFERNKPDVQVKECGLRLVYEQDVEKFVQTLAQCMLESPDAECFYQNLLHQVEERVASKDFGFSSSLQRMPQPMPVLQPSIENIAEGCTSSATSPSSFTGFLATTRKEQYASIMSSESLIKARLEKNFDEGEIFNCCFAEREIPLWFCYENKQSMKIPLAPEFVNDPDWMGFALCGLFLFNRHPTAVRQSLGSRGIEMLQFRCLLRTSSCRRRLVCYGLLTTDNELVTLNQRAFIWVMFIPRTTHAHLWSQSPWVEFQLESSIPDLSALSFGIRCVYRHEMEQLTQILVQCSAPFDSFLDSCDPLLFYHTWENYPEVFIGTKNSYDDLHPQRLFISQEEAGATGSYSYKEYLYPHNHFRCFHPSNLYNSCFPTRRTPRWFNHHCRLGHSVKIEIPPNLYEDNNWLGLALYASILIPRDGENAVSANSSHFLYCQFQTSKASLDNQILVCRTTIEEHKWLHGLFGLIWISYIPREALKDMLHQCGHIKASFVSDWPSVTVQKCGLRFLYQHDRLQFEQQLEHYNVFISAQRDFICQLSRHGTMLERMEECMQVLDKVKSPLNKYPEKMGTLNIRIVSLQWKFHVISTIRVMSHVLEIHVHRTIKVEVEFMWLDIMGGFLWLCYIPCWKFLDRLKQCSCIKASIISDWPGIIVQKCGLSFYHVHDNWFQEILKHCNLQYMMQDFNDQLTASYIAKTSRAKNQLSESHLPGFDRSCDYISCCHPIEIPHWFDIQRDDHSLVTFSLTRKLNNNSTWMGVALYAVFSIQKGWANLNDVMDSKSSYKLICHLKASNGLSVKPRHIYWPTKEDLMLSLLGGFTWLTYIPRGSFPDWLYDCASIKFSFKTNCRGLKVQKCGLHLLYQNSVEKFKNCMNSKFDISSILNQKKIENRNRKMRSLIWNELWENGTLGFDRCIFYDPHLPSSEILEWFDHRSDEPWLTIPLPPNLYNDSTWMGLVLCAYFAIDLNPTAHFDILDSDTSPGLIYHLETNVGGVRPLHGYRLTKEDLVMAQQGGCILLSYRGRNCLNQVNYIKASFTTDCQGLKVEKCGFHLLFRYELEESEQTISHSMNSSSDDWDLIHQLTTDDGHRDKQKHDNEGTSSRTSSSRKESNFGSQRGPIDPKDKGKRVLEE